MKNKISKKSNKTHHFRDEMSKYVIIHHNEKIIQRITDNLTNVKNIINKSYKVISGNYGDKKISLITTGMTAGNTAMVVDQVISQGAEYIFKLGTFGAIQDEIKVGDIYIPNGAVRSEGLTDAYAPLYFPAVPNFDLFSKITNNAENLKISFKSGIIHSVNIYSPYYQETFNSKKYSPDKYRKLGVFGVEMEVSSTFVCSSVKKAKSVAILICNRDWKTQDAFRKGKKVNWDKHQAEKKKDEATKNTIKLLLKTISDL